MALFSPEDIPEDNANLADYNVDVSLINEAFAWPKTDEAYQKVFELA